MGLLHVNASLFYCLRMAEYFLFFYVGVMSAPFFKASSVIKAFFIWNLCLMILQKLGLIGLFTSEGYIPINTDRVTGIASFPSEAGMLINLVFAYLVYGEDNNSRLLRFFPPNTRSFLAQTYVYWLFLICSALVIITGSRIAIVSLLVVFMFRIKSDLNRRYIGPWLFAAIFVAAASVMGFFMIKNTEALLERSEGLLSWKNLDLITLVWDKIDLAYDPIGRESVKFGSYDMSWWMRIHKWIYATKIYYLHPECYLQGVGPGFAMAALDGGFVRILTEYGVIGSLIFAKLFSLIYRQSREMKWMVVAFMINMIFFDVYLAYKPMVLLFYASGYAYSVSKEKSRVPVKAFV